MKSVPKMIIISLLSMVLGAAIAIIVVIITMIGAMFGNPNIGKKAFNAVSSSTENQWQEQYSMTKGKYYTDGHGNFKDANGNDVYNPQGVTDYEKL